MNYELSWEMVCFKSREVKEFKVIAFVTDDDASYSFDDLTVIKDLINNKFIIVQTSGCSCPSHEEMAGIMFESYNLSDIIKWVNEGNYSGQNFTDDSERGLLKQLQDYDDFSDHIDEVRREYVN